MQKNTDMIQVFDPPRQVQLDNGTWVDFNPLPFLE